MKRKHLMATLVAIGTMGSSIAYASEYRGSVSPASLIEPQQQQSKTIKGLILDEKGQPVIGATVKILNKKKGTVSNINGQFILKDVHPGDKISISYISYVTQTITIGTQTNLKITLKPDTKMIDEIIVVGYGQQKKENLTGAVAAVKFDKLSTGPVANTTNMLQGRLPGVVLTNNGAQAGKDTPQIRIRGVGTFGNNDPMVLIDGVESPISQIAQMDPSDIENVSVLKDAASASIYGVRAANGVILITTKRGKEGAPSFTYSTSYALQQATVLPKFVGSYDWAQMWNEANPTKAYYTKDILKKIKDQSDPDHFAESDWVGALFRTAPMYQHHLSVAGGSKTVHYMMSTQYFSQDGILKNTGAKRINFRSNLDVNLKKFKIGLNVFGSRLKISEPATQVAGVEGDNIIRSLTWFTRPTVPIQYSDGHYGYVDGTPIGASTFKNPVNDLYVGNKGEMKYTFDSKLFASYEIIKGLKVSSSLAYKFLMETSSMFYPRNNIKWGSNGKALSVAGDNSLNKHINLATGYINENLIHYDLVTDHHRLAVLAGHSFQNNKIEYNKGSKQTFPTDTKYEFDAATSGDKVKGNSKENAIQSFFGRINYSYNDKYLVEMNLRYDGSSRMPKEHRYAFFPSFSAGYVISNEAFLKKYSWLSMLKLRASWGTLGNQMIPDYQYLYTFSPKTNYYFGNKKEIGLVSSQIPNPDIRWETTVMTDLGLDLSLFNGRITSTFDWYDKTTYDILMELPLPTTFTGTLKAPVQNAGTVRNRGWEFALNYEDSRNDWAWNAGFTLSGVKNEITDMKGIVSIDDNVINKEGEAINSYYGYKAIGIYRTDKDLERTNAKGMKVKQDGNQPQLGDIMYEDINNDGNITDDDRTIIGNPFPKLQYSFTLGFSYKNMDFSSFWQGIAGIYRYNWEEPGISNGGNKTERWLDRWTPKNPNGSMPTMAHSTINAKISSFWLEKADYLRLKSLEVGYNIHQNNAFKTLGISSMRVYLSGSNLLTFSPYKNYDPEKLGNDSRNYVHPNIKSYSIGLNIKF